MSKDIENILYHKLIALDSRYEEAEVRTYTVDDKQRVFCMFEGRQVDCPLQGDLQNIVDMFNDMLAPDIYTNLDEYIDSLMHQEVLDTIMEELQDDIDTYNTSEVALKVVDVSWAHGHNAIRVEIERDKEYRHISEPIQVGEIEKYREELRKSVKAL